MNNKYDSHIDINGEEVRALLELIRKDEGDVNIVDIEKMQTFRMAYYIFRKSVAGDDVEFSSEANSPFPSVGSISAEGELLYITNPDLFDMVAKSASSMEIYPLTNGKVRMCFTFHGLTRSLD